MKKLFTAILAVLYISISTGAAVHIHYCMGKIANWGLGYTNTSNTSNICGNCRMEKIQKQNKGCCRDEHKLIKSDTGKKPSELVYQQIQFQPAALPVSLLEASPIAFSSVTEENPISHAPPRNSGIAVYIRNCTFLI